MKKFLYPAGLVATLALGVAMAYTIWNTTPGTAEDFFTSGKAYYEEKKYPEAIIELLNAIQKDDRNRDARYFLAQAYVAQKDLSAAVKHLNATSGTLNGALYLRASIAPAGSGVLDSFVRINAGGSQEFEQGYNTDLRPLQYDENNSPTFTRSLMLSAVPTVVPGGPCPAGCREFILDINQTVADPLLTLNRMVVSLRSAGNLAGATVPDGSRLGAAGSLFPEADTIVYDSLAGNQIQLDYSLESGSGNGDMFLYIPNAAFTGPNTHLKPMPACYANANDGFVLLKEERSAVATSKAFRKVPRNLRRPRIVLVLDIGEHFRAGLRPLPPPRFPFLTLLRSVGRTPQPHVGSRCRLLHRAASLVAVVNAEHHAVTFQQTVGVWNKPRIVSKLETCRLRRRQDLKESFKLSHIAFEERGKLIQN
jgi:hypothetical protein